MKLPKKIDVIRILRGKKFGGLISGWYIITEDGVEKVRGTLKYPQDYQSAHRVTTTSKIERFYGKRIVETKNSFFILWGKHKWPE